MRTDTMKIGFSGTRRGMTAQQKEALRALLADYERIEFHHGSCIGSDEEALKILFDRHNAWDFSTAHPGFSAKDGNEDDRSLWALKSSKYFVEPKPHFERNRNIVKECDLIIGAPPCEPLPEFGGTAYTINYAKKVKKDTLIIWPSGFVE